jgi:hypothetical protein
LFSKYLISSFVPAVYFQDIDFIDDITKKVGQDPDNAKSEYLILSRGVINYMYLLSKDKRTRNDFNNLKRSFSNCCNHHDPYVRAIARLFMANCLVKEAFLSKSAKIKKQLLGYALTNQKQSVVEVEKSGIDDNSRLLWMCFLDRNLARTYENLDQIDLAREHIARAVSNRETTLVLLRNSHQQIASDAFEAEYYLAVIDYARITGRHDYAPLSDISEFQCEPEDRGGSWWARVFSEHQKYLESTKSGGKR